MPDAEAVDVLSPDVLRGFSLAVMACTLVWGF